MLHTCVRCDADIGLENTAKRGFFFPALSSCQSESLHREAYNAAFREFDVSYTWTPECYDELQNKVSLIVTSRGQL